VAVKVPWRQRILQSLPSTATFRRIATYQELEEGLAEAAGKRRMHPDEYAMRAVRAFVEYDLDIDDELREVEPLLRDMRRVGLPPKRYRGREFGRWRIERLAE
jgi:hypothetical protein